jgi:predicted ArsR family transcriptional regulator
MDSMFAQVINTDDEHMPNPLAGDGRNRRMSDKKLVEDDANLAKMVYVLLQPTRQKIVKLLKSSKEPLYIEQIADSIGEDRRSVSFHLATLAEYGFVEGDYELIKSASKNPGSGRGAKFYHTTAKVDQVLSQLDTILR